MTQKPGQKTSLKGVLMLLVTALIWGTGFIAQSLGMTRLDAFTFNGVRSVLGALVLIPVILMRQKKGSPEGGDALSEEKKAALSSGTLKRGLLLGVVFCAATNFQQFAFYDSTAGKIAFITALYVLFVPLIGLLTGKRIPLLMWPCVVLGFVSLYFLCMQPGESFALNRGDLLALCCAFFFAVHILLVERFAQLSDGVALSQIQFAVTGALSLVFAFIFEHPRIAPVLEAALPLLYLGIFSSGIAYTFQILGQRHTEATIASLLMCTESVFAVVAAFLILGEKMSVREGTGCVLMLAAVICANLVGAKSPSTTP